MESWDRDVTLTVRYADGIVSFSTQEYFVQIVKDALLRTCPHLTFTLKLPQKNMF